MAGIGMYDAWSGGPKFPYLGGFNSLGGPPQQPSIDSYFDPATGHKVNMVSSAWCSCPECAKFSQDSNNSKFAYQTNKQVREAAYDFVRQYFGGSESFNNVSPNLVYELVNQFALQQLQLREQYYQRRFQDIKLEHTKQLSAFMKREKVLAKKAGEEAAAKHSVPDTSGRLFRDPEGEK